jgi:uncharacterized protein
MTHALIWIAIVVAGLALFARWIEPRVAFYPFAGEDATPRTFGLAFEPLTIETADGERLRAWRIDAPSPRARVFYFHGNGGNLSNWSPILAATVRRGYSVAALDYRGYGLSTGKPSEQGLYRDADAFVRALWVDADPRVPTILWGRSLGGAVAAYAATVRRPDGLVLEAAFPDGRAAVRDSLLFRVLGLFASYRFPTADFANRARVPVLQMHGDRDSVIPFALGQELFEKIDGPKQFVAIPGRDHNDEAPRDQEPYWGAIERFVAGLRRAR